MCHAQLLLCGSLESGYVLAKDELLRLKHGRNRIHQLPVEEVGADGRDGVGVSFTPSFYQP
jgi:hypothetical protein